jgi:hypothetical protein
MLKILINKRFLCHTYSERAGTELQSKSKNKFSGSPIDTAE